MTNFWDMEKEPWKKCDILEIHVVGGRDEICPGALGKICPTEIEIFARARRIEHAQVAQRLIFDAAGYKCSRCVCITSLK
jgi:hypothetical protein